ncbi:MAG: heme biosynthesis HemY N-terminal domain-containing protein [Alphaproteobacteria bacterium]|nr:heme biosynthesis HemY N-terminal domain-containing protein [Alphaproteobacteria bacterium]
MRLLGFLVRLAIIVGVVVWLVVQPGTARVVWHGYQIETSAAFLAVVLLGAAFVFYLLYRFWSFITEGPRIWRLNNRLNKIQRGQALLTQGLSAIAGGNAAEAGRLAVSARRLLGVTPATRLLQAQAAQLAGDHRASKEIFRAMAAEPESAVLGYRGLIMAAVRDGDWDEAERQMGNLRRLKPNTPWLNLIRFDLATRRQNWSDASAALAQAASARLLEAPRARRHQAALLVAASVAETQQGQADRALQSAEKAVKQAPDWVPALLTLAQRQLEARHFRTALRTIERAWRNKPHPHLADLYLRAGRSGSPLNAHKLMAHLTRTNPEDPASRLALAETAIAADLWGEARRHLMAIIAQGQATQKAYRLLAKLERRESGDERAAAQWLMKAAEALPDPRWLCTACGGGHDDWQVLCAHCGAFNSLEWQTPGVGRNGGKAALIAGAWEPVA